MNAGFSEFKALEVSVWHRLFSTYGSFIFPMFLKLGADELTFEVSGGVRSCKGSMYMSNGHW
jgi:hypothetical protein